MSEWIQPEHRETHEFLLDWGRWSREHTIQGHCKSMEHRYRSPQCWYPQEPRPQTPDEMKATSVEHCMRIVPKLSRKLLKFKYIYRADQAWISKRLRVSDYSQALYTARQIIKNLLWAQLAPTIHGKLYDYRLSDFCRE